MKKIYSQYFAVSIKGHDKGLVYAILREENEYVFLADGRHRKIESPKKKKKKHIICLCENKLSEYISEETPITDGRLRRAIQSFKRDNDNIISEISIV